MNGNSIASLCPNHCVMRGYPYAVSILLIAVKELTQVCVPISIGLKYILDERNVPGILRGCSYRSSVRAGLEYEILLFPLRGEERAWREGGNWIFQGSRHLVLVLGKS
jgi:hypothetical protein